MNFLSLKAAEDLLGEIEKLPAAAMAFAKAEVAKVEGKIESRVEAVEAKVASIAKTSIVDDLDTRVKAALETLMGEGLDLSGLRSAIGDMTGDDLGQADDEGGVADTITGAASDAGSDSIPAAAGASTAETAAPASDTKTADLSQVFGGSSTVAGASDTVLGSAGASSLSGGSSESSVSSGFADFSHHADDLVAGSTGNDTISGSAAAIGAADTSTTTIGTAGSQDLGAKPEPQPAQAPQKVDPATAGKQAGDAASAAGDDPVPAAAKAAYAAAVELGVDPVKAATDAAAAAGAGVPEAARAAENADAAAKQGQAPATA